MITDEDIINNIQFCRMCMQFTHPLYLEPKDVDEFINGVVQCQNCKCIGDAFCFTREPVLDQIELLKSLPRDPEIFYKLLTLISI